MIELYDLAFYGIVGIPFIAVAGLFLVSFLTPWPRKTRSDFFQTKFLYHPSGVYSQQFPCLLRKDTKEWKGPQHTKPELYLSVIVPAMNEEDRLPIMLDSCLGYLGERRESDPNFTFEVIIVDDGSKDRTPDVAFEYTKKFTEETIRVLKLPQNVGKGGAVRNGVLCARGQLILFADADDATKFSDVEKLEKEMIRLCNGEVGSEKNMVIDWTHPAVVVGSRAHLEKEAIAERSLFRTILMIGFHMVVYIFAVRSIRDTQCGFKMLSRAAAAKLFPQMHIERWAFDVELLYLAERLKVPVAEVGVEWHEVDGSKITPIISWIQMGRDILLIWFRYTFQIWRDNDLEL